MLAKKNHKKPQDHDFSALDEAVSELSKQTAVLLGKAEDTPKKPVLPKKQSKPSTKGKSFDIIHTSTNSASPKAKLKTAQPEPATTQSATPELLLPDHATKSYNEQPDTNTTVSKEPTTKEKPVIINHAKGKLHLATKEPEAEDTPPEKDTQKNNNSPQTVSKKPLGAAPPTKAVAHESVTFDDAQAPKQPDLKKEDDPKEAPTEQQNDETAETEAPKSSTESTTYTSDGLFANNLVQQSEPKRYQPHHNQQKPTVFDTNEYHQQLHDWSKLDHRSGKKVAILISLLVIAVMLGYVIISGVPIPFIGYR